MTNYVKWLSTVLFIGAGTLVSLNIEETKYAFILFFIGHVLLTYLFVKLKDMALFSQNLFFIAIDVIGIYRWF